MSKNTQKKKKGNKRAISPNARLNRHARFKTGDLATLVGPRVTSNRHIPPVGVTGSKVSQNHLTSEKFSDNTIWAEKKVLGQHFSLIWKPLSDVNND